MFLYLRPHYKKVNLSLYYSRFCPALQIMAEKMKMSDNVAGVTLLALGNGAPGMYFTHFSYQHISICSS